MRIELTGKQLEVTPAIREYAESKCARLPKYYDGVQAIYVVLMQRPHHQEFEVEVRVDVEKHDDFIAHVTGADIYECIDLSIDKLTRQLTDFKERLKNSKRGS
jgi:putative sigma-54 modulation protein